MKKYILGIALIFLVSGVSLGHSLGQSLEKQVNGYFIDVGYSAVDKIYTGEAIRFDFNLWKEGKIDIADFDHVWVRIAPKDEGIDFAGFIYRPSFLLAGMSYTFQKPGEYTLTVRFLDKDDKNLAEAAFPLIVEKDGSDRTDLYINLAIGIAGLLMGFAVAFLLFKKSSKSV